MWFSRGRGGYVRLMVAMGVVGLLSVFTFCGWAVFREPWNVSARRAERRAWVRATQFVTQPSVEPGVGVQLVTADAPCPADHAELAPAAGREVVPNDHVIDLSDLEAALLEPTTGDLHVDVSTSPMMTVKDFCALIRARRLLEDKHRRLSICGADEPRRRALEVAQLGELIAPAEQTPSVAALAS